jgi:hypothetical protein
MEFFKYTIYNVPSLFLGIGTMMKHYVHRDGPHRMPEMTDLPDSSNILHLSPTFIISLNFSLLTMSAPTYAFNSSHCGAADTLSPGVISALSALPSWCTNTD